MRILVTGSEGFIGKHLMKALPDAIGCDIGTKELTGPFDGIIHLAAVSRVKDAEADRLKCLETNILLTARMLELKPKWFIFASTCEPPTNIYGFSKRAAEDYIRFVHQKHIILRLTNVYGQGMREDKILPRLKRGDAVTLHDDALPFEYIHVDDVVAQIKRIIETFDNAAFKSYTLKMSTGVANSEKQLRHVATSY